MAKKSRDTGTLRATIEVENLVSLSITEKQLFEKYGPNQPTWCFIQKWI